MRSPFNRSVAASRAVTMIAARLAFMSQAPRPYTRPSRTTGENGSAIPPAPTVSMCALSIRLRPPPVPCSTPTTLGRPGTGSTISTSRPASPSHEEANFGIAVSPLPDATRSGFTDSVAAGNQQSDLSGINRIVVIYEENHSFDNLYGGWEGVNGLANADAAHTLQIGQTTGDYNCLMQNDVNLASTTTGPVCTDSTTATTFTSRFTNQPFSINTY